jgi:hypothetical protein
MNHVFGLCCAHICTIYPLFFFILLSGYLHVDSVLFALSWHHMRVETLLFAVFAKVTRSYIAHTVFAFVLGFLS